MKDSSILVKVVQTVDILAYHLKTLYLFSRTDIQTLVLPTMIFALGAGPVRSISHGAQALLWVWLHLLQFNISNQTIGDAPEEDKINKPFRPLPSNRISLANAVTLRWTVPVFCLALSLAYSMALTGASLALLVLTVMHNELDWASHWLGKNVLTAGLYTGFQAGSALVAGKDRTMLDDIAKAAIICSFGVISTTVQAQDFRDSEGDAQVGRRTLPIIIPRLSRFTMLLLVAWTAALLQVYDDLPIVFRLLLLAQSAAVAARFLVLKDEKADKKSYFWYNIYLLSLFAMPACYRLTTAWRVA